MSTINQLHHNKPVHILVAEDSPTQAQQLIYILERNGYRVTAAGDGRQAIAKARADRPTLVITDVLMPEMNGYELCRQIKADPDLQHLPVILVTTLADPHDVIRGLECRADNFIIKPYNEQYLLSRIQFVLVNYEMREHDKSGMGVEVYFNGKRHYITADRLQILNLLLSTYETAIQRNQELSRTKDDLRALNSSLEASNKDLESFSYSVSHDLRTPLRTIAGFSRILSDEYSEKLDENGKDLLLRVQNACERMGELIDDLLNLSQFTHSAMHREEVNLSAMVKSIAADLRRDQPERKVDFRMVDGVIVNGDPRLLRVALENLIGNAWKFTSKREQAIVEFGMEYQNGEKVFFVSDNGAGFDMARVEKLFGAFQRLHLAKDYPGTGIGLAIVQRIIRRHNGRIWPISAVDAGARFNFTL